MARLCNTEGPTSPSQQFIFTLIEHHPLFGRIQTYSREYLGFKSRIRFAFIDLTIFCLQKNMEEWNTKKKKKKKLSQKARRRKS